MRSLARNRIDEAPLSRAVPIGGTGGSVAAIQQSIRDRLREGGAFEIALARAPEHRIDRALTLLSRCAGPIALGGAYFAVTTLFLG